MADSSKPNDGENPASGEIFSEGSQSAYEQARSAPVEDLQGQQIYGQDESAAPTYPDQGGAVPPESTAPPPFVDDPRRKFFILIVFLIIIIGGGFFLFRLLSARNKDVTSENNNNKEKITLTYWGLWEEAEVMKPVIDDYEKAHPEISINYIFKDPIQYRERLQAAIKRGEGPDIFRYHNTWKPMLIKDLSPLPKDIMSDEDFTKTFYPVVAQDVKSGDNYYGLPLEIDGLVLFYNDDILSGAGVSVPQNWLEVQNTVPDLTVKSESQIVTSAIALGTAENIEHFSDILGLMFLQNGTLLDQSLFSCADGSDTCGVQTLTFYRRFADTPNNTWDNSLENSIAAFASGKVAMIFAPSWQALTIQQINPDLNFKVAKVPQLPCNQEPCPSVNWASYWVEGVSGKSKHTTESWQFLNYLTQKDTLKKLYQEEAKVRKLFGEPYSRVDMADELKDNPYLAPVIEEAPSMQSFYLASRTDDGETGIDTSLINYLKDAVNALSEHGASEETVLKTADQGFAEVFQRFNLAPAQ